MRTYVRMVVCVYLPRFELAVAAGERSQVGRQTLAGRPLAVAPLPGAEQRVGEVSGAAEARGVARGMVLGEALARCPDLMLVPGDPGARGGGMGGGDARAGSRSARRSSRPVPGLAYFEADGAARDPRHAGGGRIAAARARRSIAACAHRRCARRASARWPAPWRRARRRPLVLEGEEARRWLAGRSVELLGFRRGHRGADRAAHPPGRAHARRAAEARARGAHRPLRGAGRARPRLACGEDSPLRPRRMEERLEESMAGRRRELRRGAEARAGRAREPAAGQSRAPRAHAARRHALRAPARGRRLARARGLPPGARGSRAHLAGAVGAPAGASRPGRRAGVGGRALRAARQRSGCAVRAGARRHAPLRAARLREAIAQVRAVAGQDAALRAVCVDPDSRVPERRVVLAPIPE